MVASESHQNLVASGCCHLLGPGVVTVDGERAVAVCELLVVLRNEEGYRMSRVTANHFELSRTDRRRQITRRSSRALGNRAAHVLLTNGAASQPA